LGEFGGRMSERSEFLIELSALAVSEMGMTLAVIVWFLYFGQAK